MVSSSEASENEHLSRTVCHLCRQRKTKCDRRLPRCGFCIKAKVDCQYVTKSKKRGLRAGYVSELESRIEHLEQELESVKDHQRFFQPQMLAPLVESSPTQISPVSHTPRSSTQSLCTQRSSASTVSSTSDATSDLMKLPREFYFGLADLWFKGYSNWAPFLTREQIQTGLEALPDPVDRIDDIVLKAIIAIEIVYSTQAISLGYKGRQRVSAYLKSQVLVQAIGDASVSSIQALLIIALLDYGSDNIASTFSILAVARRMAENIGLFRQLLNRIEGESPTQIGPPSLDHCADELAIAVTWCILALDAVSSLGVRWRDVSAALIDHLSSVAYVSTPDYRDSFRTHTHLAAIGLQPVHEFLHSFHRHGVLPDASPSEECEEMYQNLISYVHGLPETSYTLLADGAIDYDPCQMFTRMLSHAAIIIIYQHFLFHAGDEIRELAQDRCHQSCSAIVQIIRSISDADAEINSPLVATFIFVAARYEVVLHRRLHRERGASFDILMHGINMCGRRWPLARRFDIVLRAATLESDTQPIWTLPDAFWDLTKSHLDICSEMKQWVEKIKPSLYVGSLNGPYV